MAEKGRKTTSDVRTEKGRKTTSGVRRKGILSRVSGMGRILMYLLAATLLILVGRWAYSLAHDVFYEKPLAADQTEGREVTVVITDDMSVDEIGTLLKENGLIEKDGLVFRLKEQISDYHDMILPGTYVLSTSMTVDEMLAVLAQVDTEGQPGAEEEEGES